MNKRIFLFLIVLPISALLLASIGGAHGRAQTPPPTIPDATGGDGALAIQAPESPDAAQGTAFTYQGRLTSSGAPANGSFDLRFILYNAAIGGSQVGPILTKASVAVVSGLFTVNLDFANQFAGNARWLEVAVKPHSGATYTTLSPRQALNAVPYALGLRPGAQMSAALAAPVLRVVDSSASGATVALRGESSSTGGTAIYGLANAMGGIATGLKGEAKSTSGYGVYGLASATSGPNSGVYGQTDSNIGKGVFGYATATSGTNYGVHGRNASTAGTGVAGEATATSGTNVGVYGVTLSPSGYGVEGYAFVTSGGVGVYGRTASTSGIGVVGSATATSGINLGVLGQTASNSGRAVAGSAISTSGVNYGVWGVTASANGYGVFGSATATSGGNKGVWGQTASTFGFGVVGWANATSGTNYGVYGATNSPSGYAGYFAGNVHVQGTLSKSSGGFKIDHPLDPANKYLYHSFVESPDMKDLYDGVVALDENGQAWVQMPEWFAALNGGPEHQTDYRYQLTPIGAGMPDLYIAQEIQDNRFKIAGGKPGMKVSWLVTGIRHDPYAEAHRLPVEQPKPGVELGTYLYPQLYGQPESAGVDYQRIQAIQQAALSEAPAGTPSLPEPPAPGPLPSEPVVSPGEAPN